MKKERMWFMAPDDGGAASAIGGIEAETPTPVEEHEHTPQEGVVDDKPDEQARSSAFDPRATAAAFKEMFDTHAAAQPKPEPAKKELSPEEAKKLLNVWEPDDAWYARFDNLETRKTAFNEMRDALVRQADTVAQIRLQQQLESINQQYQPVMQMMQRQEAEARQGRFNTTYPDLAKPQLIPLINSVVQGMSDEKLDFKGDEGKMFKEVADRVAKVIQVNNPDFKLSAPSAQKKPGGEIPVTTPGAGGGGGGAVRNETKGNKAMSVLGNV